jgi:pimeloyl-ACP methyl ester carboxylesterase
MHENNEAVEPGSDFLQKKHVTTSAGNICYFVNRDFPGKPTVVFLHGLSSNHTTWVGAAREMRRQGLNTLILDLRGHGHSDKSKKRAHYRLSVFSDDIAAVLKQEQIEKYILAGYSFGGSVAIDYAANYGDENLIGLVLVSTNFQSPLRYKRVGFLRRPIYAVLHAVSALLIWQGRRKYLYYQHGKAVGYWDSVFDGFKTMPLSVNYWMLSEMVLLDLREHIKNISAQTLIINSPKDFFISEKETNEIKEYISNSEVHLLNHPSHFLASNFQDNVLTAMTDFIKKLT